MSNLPTPQAFYTAIQDISNIIGGLTFNEARAKLQALKLPQNWFALWIVYETEPDGATLGNLTGQTPYANTTNAAPTYDTHVKTGHLELVNDEYRLTKKGREALLAGVEVLVAATAKLDYLLPAEKMDRLEALFAKVLEATTNDTSFKKYTYRRNRRSHDIMHGGSLNNIYQYITDYGTFRDDCHMATWQDFEGIDGPTWETLTFVLRNEANTAEKLQESLQGRGWDVEVYQKALDNLTNRGWLEKADDGYAVTDEGRRVREASDVQTEDNYFAAAKQALGNDAAELVALINELKDAMVEDIARRKKLQIFDLMNTAMGSLAPYYFPKTIPYFTDNNFSGQDWGILFDTLGLDEPLTLAHNHLLTPFTHADVIREQLNQAVENGNLAKVSEDGYQATEQGRRLINGFFTTAIEALEKVDNPVPEEETKRLFELLHGIITRTEKAAHPAEKPFFWHSRATNPPATTTPLARIDQYVTDLTRYREDAHFTVLRESGIPPTEWNTLTSLWNGNANTLEGLMKTLENRRQPQEAYEEALASLVKRGWATQDGDTYTITRVGRYYRDQAELETDKNFFVGWEDLSDAELDELQNLLNSFNTKLRHAAYLEVWDLAVETTNAFTPYYQPITRPMSQEVGWEQGDWFTSYAIRGTEPAPMTVELMHKLSPYRNNNGESGIKFLNGAVERGFVAEKNGTYTLTDKGRAGIDRFFTEAYQGLATFTFLPDEEIQIAHDFFKAAVENTAQNGIADKPLFDISRKTDPAGDFILAARLEQYFTDFLRFRDDCHNAAWREAELTGPQIDALSYIWREKQQTAAGLVEEMPFRGWTVEDYQSAIDQLAAKGLVQADGERYVVTDAGRTLRQNIEDKTNTYFFAGWNDLPAFQLYRTRQQLENLRTHLIENAPQPEQA